MSKKILILDDDTNVLDMLQEVLLYEKFEVRVVSDLASFLKAFEGNYLPDLVLIDYLLKGVNGGEVCYQLKSNERTAGIPVILMSAYPQIFQSLGNYGCDEFIAKPFDLDEILDIVKNHTGSSKEPVI
ncbi:MAG: response regulator [Bacteroidota bacterium]